MPDCTRRRQRDNLMAKSSAARKRPEKLPAPAKMAVTLHVNGVTKKLNLGAVVGGIGMALHEETLTDNRFGRFMTHNLADNHVPVNADVHAIDVIFVDEKDEEINPLGGSKASAKSASSEPRRRSPMRSTTPPESACAICQSPSTSCYAPDTYSRRTASEPTRGRRVYRDWRWRRSSGCARHRYRSGSRLGRARRTSPKYPAHR